MAVTLDVLLDEPVGVLLQRRVIADVAHWIGRVGRAMRRRAACHRAGLLSGFDAGVITEPADPRLLRRAPESVVDRLQRAYEHRTGGNGARAEGPHGEATPPHDRLGERTHGGAGEAASPVRIHVRPDLVTREPVDLVFLDSV